MDMSERARKIWEEIDEASKDEYPTEELRDGEVTVQTYRSSHLSRSENATRSYLNKLVERGVLIKRLVKLGQATGFAYYPVELDQQKG